jgi:hypothetical protein
MKNKVKLQKDYLRCTFKPLTKKNNNLLVPSTLSASFHRQLTKNEDHKNVINFNTLSLKLPLICEVHWSLFILILS